MHPVFSYGQDYDKQSLGNFDDLIQSDFWVIPKITFTNLSKPIYDIIFISVYSETLNMENVDLKRKNFWAKFCAQKKLFRWNKKHFS